MPPKKTITIIVIILAIILLTGSIFLFIRQKKNKADTLNKQGATSNTGSTSTPSFNPLLALDQAVKEKSTASCQQFEGEQRNNCISNVALSSGKPELCLEINPIGSSTSCVELFALKRITESETIKKCQELTDTDLRWRCNIVFFRQINDIAKCLEINGQDRTDCQDFIHKKEAYEKFDEKSCQLIVNENLKTECLRELAKKIIDSDKDGLRDLEEAHFGTDPKKADTDTDGLSDFDEIKKYNTDPLSNDTDQDGFLDGAEVSKGYDPKKK